MSSTYRFRLDRGVYRLGRRGVRTIELVCQILEEAPAVEDAGWLLAHRHRVRTVERLKSKAALTLVIARTEDERLRRLAVWLRGRCGGALETATVSRFATSPDRALRKEVVRCLKRLSAWAELRAIAETDPDPQIRRLATQSGSRPYANRLAGYCEGIPRRLFQRPSPDVFVAPEFEAGQGRPPKPQWLIRMILDRIRRLVAATPR